MSLDEDRAAFYAILKASPCDRVTRQVFADWLEELGDRPGDDDLALIHRSWTQEKYDEATAWLQSFSERHDIPYKDVLEAGRTYLDGDYSYVQDGSDSARNELYDDGALEAFWQHWCMVTDQMASEEKRGQPFSCSC